MKKKSFNDQLAWLKQMCGKSTIDESVRVAVDRLRIIDGYGIEWGNMLRDKDTDPQMAKDCVTVVRAFLEMTK